MPGERLGGGEEKWLATSSCHGEQERGEEWCARPWESRRRSTVRGSGSGSAVNPKFEYIYEDGYRAPAGPRPFRRHAI